jgi:uncharacterized protein
MAERNINVTIDGDTATLPAADFRALLGPRERRALEMFEARCGAFGDVERRTVPFITERAADSGDPEVAFTAKGHASVFGRKSLDLGGFQEVVDPGFFDDVLDSEPDVHLLWDHSTSLALARTRSSKYLLELRTDPRGLHFYAKVAPTTFAADLRILMEGGVIDQASFAFDVAEDRWEIRNPDKPDEYVLRTLMKAAALYDVTITAQGAYPQADSQVVRAYALAYARTNGRLDPEATEAEDREASTEDAAPDDPVDTEETPSREAGGDERQGPTLDEIRRQAREELQAAKTRYLRTDRRLR